jgi:hypothetical protein
MKCLICVHVFKIKYLKCLICFQCFKIQFCYVTMTDASKWEGWEVSLNPHSKPVSGKNTGLVLHYFQSSALNSKWFTKKTIQNVLNVQLSSGHQAFFVYQHIFYCFRVSLICTCGMYLALFPFDVASCKFISRQSARWDTDKVKQQVK